MSTSLKHSIKAYLYDNVLTDTPNDFIARVNSERTLGVSDLCSMAASRGGADVSPSLMQHAVHLFLKEMAYNLCDGYAINTGYFTATSQIKGVFDNPGEAFSTNKHSVYFLFKQGDTLRKELSNIKVEILGVAETGCEIIEATDVKSGAINSTLTPNRNLKIKGSKIKLTGNNTEVGVYFTNQQGTITKVDTSDIVSNKPSELIIVVPDLAAGSYTLSVKTQFCGSTLLKEVRTATFEKTLIVR